MSIINYYQSIPELGIKGRMDTPKEFDAIGLPEKMHDWAVLDVGCNIGAFLIEGNKRGCDLSISSGVEPNLLWRSIARGLIIETSHPEPHIVKSIDDIGLKNFYHLVLLLSVTHVAEGKTGQEILDQAWSMVKKGGMLILEVNDRLQTEKLKLPEGAKLYGKNKDNRSVWHIYKT